MPILLQPVSIADGTLEVEDISVAVRRLRMGRAGVPSDMKAEHLKAWIMEATRKKPQTLNIGTNW